MVAVATKFSRPQFAGKSLRAFRPELFGGRQEATEAARDCGHALRAVLVGDPASVQYCQDRTHLKQYLVQTAGSDGNGGFLVPDHLANVVLDVRDRTGLLSQLARHYSMGGEKDFIAKRLTGLTVDKAGETNAITPSDKTWAQIEVQTDDASTLTLISRKLMRGSVIGVVDDIATEIGYAFAQQQDYEGFNGTGAAGFPNFGITGIVPGLQAGSKITATGATSYETITNDHLTNLMALLPDRFFQQSNGPRASPVDDTPAFICSRRVWAKVFERLMIQAGGNNKIDLAAATPFQYSGFPIYFTEQMPSSYAASQTCILFGNLKQAVILAEREGVEVATSSHFKFAENQLAIRGNISYDINFHEPGDATNSGAVVALVTP